jgi:hypothetical protein
MQTLVDFKKNVLFLVTLMWHQRILMLMNVADKFNFKVNTFTHILEGYKVADK